jgi:chemotaxis protein histidine kinase CheA
MGMTLRQFQKLLHKSKRPDFQSEARVDLARFAETLCGHDRGEWGSAKLQRGCLLTACDCRACREKGYQTNDVTSLVDSLCHRYGPDIDAVQALKKWLQAARQSKEQPPPGSGSGDEQPKDQGRDQDQGQEQSSDSSESQGQGEGEGKGEPQPQPLSAADEAALKEWRKQQDREAREAAQEEEQKRAAGRRAQARRQKAAAAVKAAAAALKAAKKQQNPRGAKRAQVAMAAAKRQLESFEALPGPPIPCGPSREARRQIAGATARLRRVSPKLRQQLAELINRLVSTSGTAGEEVAPTPMIDSRKLVKRMLVRRPLANALKEDVQRGRPVTLFLPDISPSCAAQAQDACDIANAAGYAGVAGSDVLVLPHSNGCVEYGEGYTPWFNGKPAPLDKKQYADLLEQVLQGKSRYRIRVVVAVGDHDAEEMYKELLRLRQITKLIWLHSDINSRGEGRAAPAPTGARPDWASDRLHMVYGCINMKEMLNGLKLSLT